MDDALLDDLLKPGRWSLGGDRCPVAQALDLIEDEAKRSKVAAACDDDKVSGERVSQVFFRLAGQSPSPATIRIHQRRDCRCSR
jgi:methylphosphotriester-DNA--protein-cysteine methyltransferase